MEKKNNLSPSLEGISGNVGKEGEDIVPPCATDVTTTVITGNADAQKNSNVSNIIGQFESSSSISTHSYPSTLSPKLTNTEYMSSRNLGETAAPNIPMSQFSRPAGGKTIDDEDDDVEYISEEEISYSNPTWTTANDFPSASNSYSKYSSGTKSAVSHGTSSYATTNVNPNMSSAATSSRSRPQSGHCESKNLIEIMSPLGNFESLDPSSEVARMIHLYAKNSVHLSPKSKMKIKIHTIYKKKSLFGFLSGSSTVTKPKKKQAQRSGTNELKMLLWCKTTPDIIRRLSKEDNSCMAFYDRLSRSLPIPVEDIKEDFRQIVLLCSVSLGNMYKSPQGYTRWRTDFRPPFGYDSVKGTGKYKPIWHDNCQYKSTIVPCGETERDSRFPTFQIDFNEYMIFKADQVKVKFAVDIEISQKTSR